jgi:hypothetical protein
MFLGRFKKPGGNATRELRRSLMPTARRRDLDATIRAENQLEFSDFLMGKPWKASKSNGQIKFRTSFFHIFPYVSIFFHIFPYFPIFSIFFHVPEVFHG